MEAYVTVNGLRTYYQEFGEGEPVVLLHGGGVTVESWAQQVPALAEHYRVVLPERRGHGRTPDVEGPVSFAVMGEDTAAFLDELGISAARVAGWSNGGAVAMHLALHRPDLVSKLVFIGAHAENAETTEQGRALINGDAQSRAALQAMFEPIYAAFSPDPGHFPVMLEKWLKMWQDGPGLAVEDLAAITAPTDERTVQTGDPGDRGPVEHDGVSDARPGEGAVAAHRRVGADGAVGDQAAPAVLPLTAVLWPRLPGCNSPTRERRSWPQERSISDRSTRQARLPADARTRCRAPLDERGCGTSRGRRRGRGLSRHRVRSPLGRPRGRG